MKDMEDCPYKIISRAEGLLCFNPVEDEFQKRPERIIRDWCLKDHRSCPHYLEYKHLSLIITNRAAMA